MKRHEALVPLSREHHETLILAQLLKKDAPPYKGLPQDLTGKIIYAKALFKEKIENHFAAEDLIISDSLKNAAEEVKIMGTEISNEHIELRKRFNALNELKTSPEELDELGAMLEKHVRKEEREFFPLVEQVASPDIIENIIHHLTHAIQVKTRAGGL